MLWFDNHDHRPLDMKVQRAAIYFQKKFGHKATVCYVHPSMILGDSVVVGEISVRASTTVLPHHFWLGADEPIRRAA